MTWGEGRRAYRRDVAPISIAPVKTMRIADVFRRTATTVAKARGTRRSRIKSGMTCEQRKFPQAKHILDCPSRIAPLKAGRDDRRSPPAPHRAIPFVLGGALRDDDRAECDDHRDRVADLHDRADDDVPRRRRGAARLDWAAAIRAAVRDDAAHRLGRRPIRPAADHALHARLASGVRADSRARHLFGRHDVAGPVLGRGAAQGSGARLPVPRSARSRPISSPAKSSRPRSRSARSRGKSARSSGRRSAALPMPPRRGAPMRSPRCCSRSRWRAC